MATNNITGDSIEPLKTVVNSTIDLISQLEDYLHSNAFDADDTSEAAAPLSSQFSTVDSVDPFALAHDSATLIKAHATKLSLLIINEPFTPSAIIKVLREMVAGPIPALASAVQVCDVHKCTTVARQDLSWRCHRVLKELKSFVGIVPLDGNVLSNEKKNGTKGGKGSMASTGVIWAACDDVILLKNLGIAGLLVKKVEEYRDTLKDILEELKEYSEEDDEEDEEEGINDVTNQIQHTHISTQEMLDDLMNPRHIPKDDPDKIRERLEFCMKRLRLTTLLYTAIVKRRLKTLPALPNTTRIPVAQRLDEVFPLLKRLPHRFGEVACAFYELDRDSIDRTMDSCFFDAFATSEMMMKPWEGQRDEFTDWAEKFQVGIKKPD
ncbi:uncharacterized protein GGS22DRAFT_101644 [Annulohypoxylon maeteangense]|uniref:uncharacterized protein n=1 Tax=Annulohypoxylon maeteangense TaxID=1927788 RepID=UPI0020073306|nr:uncharacterized protein GGS22DRAFT_101644 [Annulohypoxylon maeteangense]KAI0880019.1 hypothetical protein GGS22DRAFT_101644 [Annulohypoxylon maeteangense]